MICNLSGQLQINFHSLFQIKQTLPYDFLIIMEISVSSYRYDVGIPTPYNLHHVHNYRFIYFHVVKVILTFHLQCVCLFIIIGLILDMMIYDS